MAKPESNTTGYAVIFMVMVLLAALVTGICSVEIFVKVSVCNYAGAAGSGLFILFIWVIVYGIHRLHGQMSQIRKADTEVNEALAGAKVCLERTKARLEQVAKDLGGQG